MPDGTLTDKNTFSHTFSDEYLFYLDFQGRLHAFPLSGNMEDKYQFPKNTNILTDEFAAVMWYDNSLVCIRYDDKEYKFEPYVLDEKNEYYSIGEPVDSGYYFRGLLKIVAGENRVFYYTAYMAGYAEVEIP